MAKIAPTFEIYCPGGSTSQTGTAVLARYPNAAIVKAGDKVPEVAAFLKSTPGPFAIPIWNSHQGVILASKFIWEGVQQGTIWISDLWAKRIEFWWLRRIGDTISHKRIGSVTVAKMQCSVFLEKYGFELDGWDLTTVAYEKYQDRPNWDGVLVADGQCGNEDVFEVIDKRTANPNNFTSFVLFEVESGQKNKARKTLSWLTGVTMPRLETTVAEVSRSLFDAMLVSDTVDDLPRLTFIIDWVDRIGLLFEGPKFLQGDILDAEDLENREVEIHEQVGHIKIAYNKDLFNLFKSEFQELVNGDFILHEGEGTCLFLCPPLGLYTHGFEVATVDPVFRFYISRVFALWSKRAIKCSEEQEKFFKRNKRAWEKNGLDFIKFERISAAG